MSTTLINLKVKTLQIKESLHIKATTDKVKTNYATEMPENHDVIHWLISEYVMDASSIERNKPRHPPPLKYI